MHFNDVAGNGPGRFSSPRHEMQFDYPIKSWKSNAFGAMAGNELPVLTRRKRSLTLPSRLQLS